MIRFGLLAVFACACGRLGFGATDTGDAGTRDGAPDDAVDGALIDVLLGHDEDSDGVPDTSDLCPHIPDPMQLDGDGDQVGDLCDPQPTLGVQSWQLFASLTASTIGFTRSGSWTVNADDWSFIDQTNPNQLIRTSPAVANIDVWMGITIDSVTAGGRQAAIVIHNGAANPYYYGELFEGGSARVNIMEYDGNAYNAIDSDIFGGTFPLGAATLHLQARTGIGASFTMDVTTTVGSYQATVPTPNYTGAMNTILAFGNTTGRVHYIAIVTTQ